MTLRIHRPLAGLLLAVLPALAPVGTGLAGERSDTEASTHLYKAEIALHRTEYLEAAREYRLAAEQSDNVEIAVQATRVASSYGFSEEALRSAERWLELQPESDEALFHLARLQLRTGDTRAATRSFRKLLEQKGDPGDESGERDQDDIDQQMLSLTGVLGEEEDAEAAYKVMQSIARPYKDSAAANYATAVIAVQAGEIKDARKLAERALELEPGEWLRMRTKLLYGRILLLEGNEDEAISYVARIIGDNPQPDPAARMELALLMMSAGRDDDALSQVNQIQYETGNNPDALRLMAIINFRQENLDAAREDFEDLLATGQHSMDALYYLARIADYRGDVDRAIGLYSKVTTGGHAVMSQRRAAALTAIERQAPESAMSRLEEFARNQPMYAVDMIQSKAQLLAAMERYPEALEYYDRMLAYRPESESVMLGRAELLLRMDRVDDSVAQYRAAVKRWPESALSLNALGYTLADRTDRYRDAEKYIKKAIKLDPDNPAIIDSLGWVLHKLGKNEEALVELERAYAMFDDPEVAAHIVEVLAALDREAEALEVLVAAEEKTPESKLLADVRERVFPAVE